MFVRSDELCLSMMASLVDCRFSVWTTALMLNIFRRRRRWWRSCMWGSIYSCNVLEEDGARGGGGGGEEAGEHVAATVALVLALVLAVAIVLKVAVAVAYAEWSQNGDRVVSIFECFNTVDICLSERCQWHACTSPWACAALICILSCVLDWFCVPALRLARVSPTNERDKQTQFVARGRANVTSSGGATAENPATMKRRVIRKRENTSVRIAVLRKSHGNLERICLRTCTVLGTVLLPYRNRHTRAKCGMAKVPSPADRYRKGGDGAMVADARPRRVDG